MSKKFLVGGAVRDELLNRPIHDRDYVVVGATVEEMLAQGYKQVGKEFPVFLDENGEEYALARKEISTGDKYTDFKFIFTPDITLREDLERRDFTVNALAKDLDTGVLTDYFNGLTDLKNGIIRHINSEHFVEDPLRVLRGIRQSCEFQLYNDFVIAEDTLRLMQDMTQKGMLNALTEERVWKEIEKALNTPYFYLFIHYLDVIGALEVILPEVATLKNVPENTEYHPEGNAYAHTILTLKEVAQYNLNGKDLALVNFALMCHDLGKALTPKEELPAHHGHDFNGLKIINKLCNRLKVPNDFRDFAKTFCNYHMQFYNFLDRRTVTQYDLIETLTKFKDNHVMNLIQKCHACDKLGREGFIKPERVELMLKVFNRMNLIYTILYNIGLKDLPQEVQERLSHYKGEKFGKLYRDAKISYLKAHLKTQV